MKSQLAFAHNRGGCPFHVKKQSFAAVAPLVKRLEVSLLHEVDIQAIGRLVREQPAGHLENLVKPEKDRQQDYKKQQKFLFGCHLGWWKNIGFFDIISLTG